MDFNKLVRRFGKFASDNSPAILTGVAVAGVVTTAYLTGKASFKAADVLQKEQARRILRNEDSLDTREKTELSWKFFVPPAMTGLATVGAIVAINQIGTRRTAALAAAYAISDKAFDEYRSKVVEKFGEKKEQAVQDEIAQDRVNRNPVSSNNVVIIDGKSVLCYEAFTGRYFLSDMETLKRAVNQINYTVNNCYYASLTELYDLLGLPSTAQSDEVGWNADKLLELKFSTTLSEDGRPCIVVDYAVAPIRNFSRLA